MVDAVASLQGTQEFLGRPAAAASAAASPAIVTVSSGQMQAADGLAGYATLAASGIHSPAQSPIRISSWIAEVRPDHLVATLQRGGQEALSIALEVVRSGPFRVARFMGGRSADDPSRRAVPIAKPAKRGKSDWRSR